MRKQNFIAIIFASAIAGCTPSQQIDGNYHSDPNYTDVYFSESELDTQAIENMKAHSPKLTIKYPEIIITHYSTSYSGTNLTHVTEISQTNELKRINTELYLSIDQKTNGEAYSPIYFDIDNDCFYLWYHKFIKSR